MARIVLGLLLLIPLTSVGLWLNTNPGDIEASWLGYRIGLSTTAAFVLLAGIIVVVMVLSVLLHGMFQWPYVHRLHSRLSRHEHGLEHITRGLSALAIGDSAKARKELVRAARALPHTPLPHLLAAQANLQSRDLEKAKPHLVALLDHKATAYIGFKRLLEQAKLAGNSKEYRELLDKARAKFPYDDWLAERFIANCLAEQRYAEALAYLEGFHLRHAFARGRRQHLSHAIRFAQVTSLGSEHASDYVPYLRDASTVAPAAALVARHSTDEDALRHIRALWNAYKAYPQKPVREAVLMMMGMVDSRTQHTYDSRMARFAKRNDDAALLAAQRAVQIDHYEGASILALRAFELRPTKEAASLAAMCYQKLAQPSQAEVWYQHAMEAPRAESWQCTACGHVHQHWQITCNACDAVGSIHWQDVQSAVEIPGLMRAA